MQIFLKLNALDPRNGQQHVNLSRVAKMLAGEDDGKHMRINGGEERDPLKILDYVFADLGVTDRDSYLTWRDATKAVLRGHPAKIRELKLQFKASQRGEAAYPSDLWKRRDEFCTALQLRILGKVWSRARRAARVVEAA